MVTVFPDVSVNINQKRLMCVLDPGLALLPVGLWLAKRLSVCMDVWIPREFWHIVDNTQAYQHWPQKLQQDCLISPHPLSDKGGKGLVEILQAWEQIQINPDSCKTKLYYFADSKTESVLPEGIDPATIWTFETFGNSLDNRLQSRQPLLSAYRDALALTVALPSAFMLSCLGERGAAPVICQQANSWREGMFSSAEDGSWLQLEQTFIRQHLVLAGLAKLHWAGLNLAVLHVVIPTTLHSGSIKSHECYESISDNSDNTDTLMPTEMDYWQDARGFWYPL